MCLRWTGGRHEDADEAYSRVAATVFVKLSGCDQALLNARAWLLRLTYNICIDLHRERKRKREESLDSAVEDGVFRPGTARLLQATVIDPAASPEDQILAGELRALLLRGVAQLPPRLRSALELHLFEEMSYRQIAEALAITEVNVRKRVQEARQALRVCLQAYRTNDTSSPGPAMSARAGRERPAGRHTLQPAVVSLPAGVERDAEILLTLTGPPSEHKIAALAKYLSVHPRGWKKRLELARLLCAAGRFDEAIPHYRAALARQPEQPEAWVELGSMLRRLDREAEAAEIWEEAARKVRSETGRAHLRALAENARGNREAAEAGLCSALVAAPADPLPGLSLAELHLERDRPVEALAALDAVLVGDPLSPAALLLGHSALLAAGRSGEAERRALLALEQDRSNPLALARVVDFRLAAGHVRGEEGRRTAHLLRALGRLGGAWRGVCERTARLHLARGEHREAVACVASELRAHPRHLESWVRYGRILAAAGKADEAAGAFLRALQLASAPLDAGLARLLAEMAPLLARRSAAGIFARFVSFGPYDDFWSSASAAARILAGLGRAEHARELSTHAVSLQSALPLAWLRHGQVLARIGQTEEAVAALWQAWERRPAGDGCELAARIALLMSACCWRRKAPVEARLWCEVAFDGFRLAGPVLSATALALRGQALQGLGDLAAAAESYRSALECGLTFPDRRLAQEALQKLTNARPATSFEQLPDPGTTEET